MAVSMPIANCLLAFSFFMIQEEYSILYCLVVGSFSFSVFSGKVMFRDVHLITEDFSVRVQLGMVIFRWWRPLTHKEITEGKRQSAVPINFTLH